MAKQANSTFVGRDHELKTLDQLMEKRVANLVAIKGRRRIGKSRLVAEFAKDKAFFRFSGLPPFETDATAQKMAFAETLSQYGIPSLPSEINWELLFWLLAERVKREKQAVILLDEISWMSGNDPAFLGYLKNAWDHHFSQIPGLMVVLCGSVSTWIEKNIISSTGFLGRIALKMTLQELSLADSALLLDKLGFRGSTREQLQLLAVTGGVPWYIENIFPKKSAEQNIQSLCFAKDGLFVTEFQHIFHDLFERRGDVYESIVTTLSNGPLEYQALVEASGYTSSGALSDYLRDLMITGYISHDTAWSLKTGKPVKISQYRLADNYLRFYLKYIAPKKAAIQAARHKIPALSELKHFDAIMGFQFEHLVRSNIDQLFSALNIEPSKVTAAAPFYQRATKRYPGCQVDLLIQMNYQTLYLVEVKFTKNTINKSVIKSVGTKLEALVIPRQHACLPVLVHVGEIDDSVRESGFFHQIIDVGDWI